MSVVAAQGVHLNVASGTACVYEFSVAHINADMGDTVAPHGMEKHKVAGLQIVVTHFLADMSLLTAGSGQMHALAFKHLGSKTATVGARPRRLTPVIPGTPHAFSPPKKRVRIVGVGIERLIVAGRVVLNRS
jgi:hypothetical protein